MNTYVLRNLTKNYALHVEGNSSGDAVERHIAQRTLLTKDFIKAYKKKNIDEAIKDVSTGNFNGNMVEVVVVNLPGGSSAAYVVVYSAINPYIRNFEARLDMAKRYIGSIEKQDGFKYKLLTGYGDGSLAEGYIQLKYSPKCPIAVCEFKNKKGKTVTFTGGLHDIDHIQSMMLTYDLICVR